MIRAVVLEISGKKTVFGILGSNGQCSSGSCEGCQCSRSIKKVSLSSKCCPDLKKGMMVELHKSPVYIVHFVLMICLPLAVLAVLRILPVWNNALNLKTLNAISLGAGFMTFLLTTVLIKLIGKKDTVTVHPIQERSAD